MWSFPIPTCTRVEGEGEGEEGRKDGMGEAMQESGGRRERKGVSEFVPLSVTRLD